MVCAVRVVRMSIGSIPIAVIYGDVDQWQIGGLLIHVSLVQSQPSPPVKRT